MNPYSVTVLPISHLKCLQNHILVYYLDFVFFLKRELTKLQDQLSDQAALIKYKSCFCEATACHFSCLLSDLLKGHINALPSELSVSLFTPGINIHPG